MNNIVLDYKLRIYYQDHTVFSADRAEFFMDEHSVHWVKFVAKNGANIGKEHIVRTEQIMIVKEKDNA